MDTLTENVSSDLQIPGTAFSFPRHDTVQHGYAVEQVPRVYHQRQKNTAAGSECRTQQRHCRILHAARVYHQADERRIPEREPRALHQNAVRQPQKRIARQHGSVWGNAARNAFLFIISCPPRTAPNRAALRMPFFGHIFGNNYSTARRFVLYYALRPCAAQQAVLRRAFTGAKQPDGQLRRLCLPWDFVPAALLRGPPLRPGGTGGVKYCR